MKPLHRSLVIGLVAIVLGISMVLCSREAPDDETPHPAQPIPDTAPAAMGEDD